MFITAQSQVITAHFVYHCTAFYALISLYIITHKYDDDDDLVDPLYSERYVRRLLRSLFHLSVCP